VVVARAAGVILALGYDSGPPGSSANELLRLAEAGLSRTDALRAATIGGAAALGRPDLGRIAVGGPADVVIVDGRPDEDLGLLTRPSSIIAVMRSGEFVG
jgi:imidazolonepropionase-like amidohydrolase